MENHSSFLTLELLLFWPFEAEIFSPRHSSVCVAMHPLLWCNSLPMSIPSQSDPLPNYVSTGCISVYFYLPSLQLPWLHTSTGARLTLIAEGLSFRWGGFGVYFGIKPHNNWYSGCEHAADISSPSELRLADKRSALLRELVAKFVFLLISSGHRGPRLLGLASNHKCVNINWHGALNLQSRSSETLNAG